MKKKQYLDKPLEASLPEMNGLSRRDFMKLAAVSGSLLGWTNNLRAAAPGQASLSELHLQRYVNSHDLLSLPDWGPYSKKYFGVSHIPDVSRGLSFDLSLFPLLASGPVKLPGVMDDDSGVHPWQAAPRMEFYSMRMETIWKDQVYCDISYSQISNEGRLARLELVNQTGAPHDITLNCLAQLVFPPLTVSTAQPIRLYRVELPPGARWIDAVGYSDLQFAKPRPTDNLVGDGLWRGEERRHETVGGSVVGQGFGRDADDSVRYKVRLERPISNAVLVWRFQLDAGEKVAFKLDGVVQRAITFAGSGKFITVAVPVGDLQAGECDLRFTSLGGAPVALDGFVLAESGSAGQLHFVEAPWHPAPQIETVPATNGLILKYGDVSNAYGFALGVPWAGRRELKWRDLDAAFGSKPGGGTELRIFGSPERQVPGDPDSLFVHTYSKPITLEPNSRRVIYGLVSTGPEAEVRRSIEAFDSQSPANERVYHSMRKKIFQVASTPAGEPYKLSQRLMAAVTLSNLVYPLYTQGQYIRHYSPGRAWDCLYTWDSGFTGLGLLEIDLRCAVEILNLYTTPPGSQSAYIHHGTPVPTQIYLFWEMWNRTQSRELLEYFYPRLRQYHLFMAGRLGSSTTRRHRDHLICTWDYFYNSGGWDDYPPQKYSRMHNLYPTVAPVVNSVHTIRCAKFLRVAASALGRTDDFAEYDEDISQLARSLQKYSWDQPSGYFGYVMHDERGEPTGILRYENGVNFNMGLDGVYPLVASMCSPKQEKLMLDHLFCPSRLWMDIGLTTVDQSAPYYIPDGYWNGSVWLAHQWFFWKAMLDMGRGDLALRIQKAGIDLWERATDSTYNCYEHFKPRPPIGRGWPQLSSLSSPALSWFASLYTPGRLTCGFEVWVKESRFSQGNRRLEAKLKPSDGNGRHEFTVLVSMNPDSRYQARWNGTPATFTTPHEGLLQIQLPYASRTGELIVDRI